jgi:predicted dinucleotide-binding enzyme
MTVHLRCLPHFRRQNAIVRVKCDNTETEVIRELLEAGDIILAYNALPYQRLNDLIAV